MSVSSRIRTKAIAGIAGLCLAVATPLAVRAESLADAMAEAYRSSGLLEQNRAVLRAADEDEQARWLRMLDNAITVAGTREQELAALKRRELV